MLSRTKHDDRGSTRKVLTTSTCQALVQLLWGRGTFFTAASVMSKRIMVWPRLSFTAGMVHRSSCCHVGALHCPGCHPSFTITGVMSLDPSLALFRCTSNCAPALHRLITCSTCSHKSTNSVLMQLFRKSTYSVCCTPVRYDCHCQSYLYLLCPLHDANSLC